MKKKRTPAGQGIDITGKFDVFKHAKTEELTESAGNSTTLLEHLSALRHVLFISAIAIIVAFFLVYYFAIEPLMTWIIAPIQRRGIEIIYTAMSEALVTKFKVALIAAILAASPVITWQVWRFIKPALYEREKKVFRNIIFVALALFISGVIFCYKAVYLLAVDFFSGSREPFGHADAVYR